MLTSQYCPQHDCPLIQVGDEAVCLIKHARSLLDNPIQDLIVDQGLIVLIWPGNVLLPLVGWGGNPRAADEESATVLLDIFTGLYLSGIPWHQRAQELAIYLADTPGVSGKGHWSLTLTF